MQVVFNNFNICDAMILEMSMQPTKSTLLLLFYLCFSVRQNPPLPPGPIQFTLIQPDSISLVWGPPKGLTSSQNFKLSWKGGGTEDSREVSGSNISIHNLLPGEKYEFTVVTLGEDNNHSECVSAITHTGTVSEKCGTI